MVKIFLLNLLVITSISAYTQTNHKTVLPNKIDNYLDGLNKQGFSGAVLVGFEGKKIFVKGFGHSDEDKGVVNNPNTVFDIGSLTKQFTAAAILKLQMQGELTVNDKIGRYFKSVPKDKNSITIHHLLTHTAGFVESIGDDYAKITETEFITKAFDSHLISAVGKEHHYSNIGYSLLAIIIQKVSGASYESYLHKNLFVPAKMFDTGYVLPRWNNNQIAIGYNHGKKWGKPNEKNWSKMGPYLHLLGNGGILSTVEDMYRWHNALLANEILDGKAKKMYYTPYVKEAADAPSSYAYGWAIFPTPRNTQLITHNGSNGIFFADFWRYLNEQITIIVLTNNYTPYSEIIAMQIAGLILREDYQPQMPDENTTESVVDESIDLFVHNVFTSIVNGNKKTWAKFIGKKASQNFKNMAPLNVHFTFFSKFKKRLKAGKVVAIDWQDDEIIARIKTPKENFDMIINFSLGSDKQLKLDGVMLD
jgi:CubicO group peptidase (beta-lactamase class C family)